MAVLGYDRWSLFKKAINKAIAACATLGVSIFEHFTQCTTIIDGKPLEDFKLSRFACCLTALNGDTKKSQVAAAQVYFISLANIIHDFPVPTDGAERLLIREEITEQEVSLAKTASAAGVQFFDRFKNAGYRGMYNMEYSVLKKLKKEVSI